MNLTARLSVLALVTLAPLPAVAQDRPFVFSVTTVRETPKPHVLVDYGLGVGDSAFRIAETSGPEQRVGVEASVGRWTLLGRFGLAATGSTYRTSQHGEVLFSLLTQASSGVGVAIGGGMLREAGGTNVALARVVAGRDWEQWRLHGNLLLQKPMGTVGRDAADFITTVGWARRLGRSVSVGVEGIAEDLEGFWDPLEAEGGARLLVGPSLHVAPPGRKWQLSFAGGPMFHPSDTGRTSLALRDLPQGPASRGYALRASFACGF